MVEALIASWGERRQRTEDERPRVVVASINAEALAPELFDPAADLGVVVVAAGELTHEKAVIEFEKPLEQADVAFLLMAGPVDDPAPATRILSLARSLARPVYVVLPEAALGTGESSTLKVLKELSEDSHIVGYTDPAHIVPLVCELADRARRNIEAQPLAPGTPEYERLIDVLGPPSESADEERRETPLPAAALRLFSDAPIRDETEDHLQFGDYAEALATLIDNPRTSTPLVMAVNAPWGAGKTSLGRLIERKLLSKAAAGSHGHHVTRWFNAWLHDDAPALGGAFAADVARTAHDRFGAWRRLLRPLPRALLSPSERTARLRRNALVYVVLALIISLPVFYGEILGSVCSTTAPLAQRVCEAAGGTSAEVPATQERDGGLGVGLLLTAILAPLVTLIPNLASAAQAVGSFVARPATEAGAGSMRRVREQLGELIRRARADGGRFVVFVDDIERCTPPRCVDLLEAINQLLDHEGVVVVVLGDMAAVAANVEIKYGELAQKHVPESGRHTADAPERPVYGRLYLQKIVQYQFNLPALDAKDLEQMLRKIVQGGSGSNGASEGEVGEEAQESEDEGGESAAEEVGADTALEPPPSRQAPFAESFMRILWRCDPSPELTLAAVRARFAGWPQPFRWAFAVALRPLVAGTRSGYPFRNRTPDDSPTSPTLFDRALIGVSFAHMGLNFTWSGAILILMGVSLLSLVLGDATRSISDVGFQLLGAGVTWSLGLGVLFLFVFPLAWLRARQHQSAQQGRVERTRKRARDAPATEPGSAQEERDLRYIAELKLLDPRYIAEQKRLALVNDSKQLFEALGEALAALPMLPRNGKRLLNRLRVQLLLTDRRKLLGHGDGRVSPSAIGLWVVLQERWPELAQALRVSPGRFDPLADAAAQVSASDPPAKPVPDSFTRQLATLAPILVGDAALIPFLAKSDSLRKGTLARLVRLRPD